MIEEGLQKYLWEFCPQESDLLKRIDRETHLEVLMPRMLSGHYQGRVLSLLSKLITPKNILEIGTFTGYATLCLAEGLHPKGKLYTVDINEELKERVQRYFDESAYASQIEYLIGDAKNIIPSIEQTFDLVFIDADKKNNETYFHQIINKVRPNGIIIVDNVLWSGRIVAGANDKDSKNIRNFNTVMKEDHRIEQLILPVRDGLMILRKR